MFSELSESIRTASMSKVVHTWANCSHVLIDPASFYITWWWQIVFLPHLIHSYFLLWSWADLSLCDSLVVACIVPERPLGGSLMLAIPQHQPCRPLYRCFPVMLCVACLMYKKFVDTGWLTGCRCAACIKSSSYNDNIYCKVRRATRLHTAPRLSLETVCVRNLFDDYNSSVVTSGNAQKPIMC